MNVFKGFIRFFLGSAVLFCTSEAVCLMVAGDARSDDAVCVFMSQKDNAWVVRRDASVKSSLKVGDAIFAGDRLVVTHGNTVQLAFDQGFENAMLVEGDSELQISGARPTRVELAKGKIFAILDKGGPASQFQVVTPSSVAAVRGTQYQVNVAGPMSQVMTYRGQVRVAGRDATGAETDHFVLVDAGMKTAVEDAGKSPSQPQAMSQTEQHEVDGVIAAIQATKASAGADIAKWFKGSEKEKGSDEKGEEVKLDKLKTKGKFLI